MKTWDLGGNRRKICEVTQDLEGGWEAKTQDLGGENGFGRRKWIWEKKTLGVENSGFGKRINLGGENAGKRIRILEAKTR